MTNVWELAAFTAATALVATALMLVPGVGLAWLLARKDFRGKTLVETAVSLPLVLPPVATGLLLLWVFGRRGPLGSLSAPSASRWSSRRPPWCWR